MRLQFLGTGGYHPTERRHTSCVLLPEIGLAFDAGTSFFRVPSRLRTNKLDVFLSHAHLDHISGLTYFIVPLISGQVERLRVHGHPQTLDAVRTHLFAEALFPVGPQFEFVPLKDEVSLDKGGLLTHAPLVHPGGSTGYRIDWPDRSLAFITDTTVEAGQAEFVRGVDVLIHECNFSDELSEWTAQTGHSSTTPVAEIARDAGVGKLYLTHFDPQLPGDDPIGIETARKIFPATEIAEDLLEIDF